MNRKRGECQKYLCTKHIRYLNSFVLHDESLKRRSCLFVHHLDNEILQFLLVMQIWTRLLAIIWRKMNKCPILSCIYRKLILTSNQKWKYSWLPVYIISPARRLPFSGIDRNNNNKIERLVECKHSSMCTLNSNS